MNQVGDPQKRKEQEKIRQDRVTDLTNRIAAIEKVATKRFAKLDAKLAKELEKNRTGLSDNVLVANHRKREQSWHYTTEKPVPDWSAVGFRAQEA